MSGPNKRTTRAADAPVVLVALDPAHSAPLHRQVYDGVRDAIVERRLAPGARLPSTRALAADLGVARNTVALAFDQLRVEGYIAGRRGGGTRVRATLPDALLTVRATRDRRARSATARSPAARPTLPALSTRGRALVVAGAAMAAHGDTPPVPFRLGVPALDAFPARVWARLTARRWRHGAIELGHVDPAGDPALRAAIAEYVEVARGARCTASNVIVLGGAQQALDVIARLLLDPGDGAWIEDPGYGGARAPIAATGARVVPVRVDDEGLDVREGERLAPDARLAYVTPSHQFPLGAVMSAPRRLALLAWARRAGAWIIEDDYDSEFRYTGRPLPCLQGVEAEQRRTSGDAARVIYIGTFSKTLVPGLRLGYLIVPDALVDPVRAARAATERHSATLAQGVLADFIGEGHYARHVRRVRALYAERQGALLDAAESRLSGLLSLASDAAGLHLVGWLPDGVRDVAAARAAFAQGVEVYALSTYYGSATASARRPGLVFNYAGYDERAIRRGVERLARGLSDRAIARRMKP